MTEEMKKALSELETAKKRVEDIKKSCPHHIVSSEPENPEEGEGVCQDCGHKTHSWFCPQNPPTHVCEYTQESGECCIHCGNPEERK